ncbi:unnamed protein product, partial [Discosporangium mesarthrocarpum]
SQVAPANGNASSRTSKRQKRDPNRPRGYISAFNFFVQDKRPVYIKLHPEVQVGHSLGHNNAINKTLGKLWKLTTSEERRYYEDLATKDKLRYLQVYACNCLGL